MAGKKARVTMKKRIVILGAIVIEIAMAFALVPWVDYNHVKTADFVNFYAAATIVRQGHAKELYRSENQDVVLESILGRHVTEYFLHPPFEAAILAPLSYLSLERAYIVWTLFNLALLGLLPLIFSGCASFVCRKPFLGLIVFVFPPVLTALTLGQDSIAVLVIISVGYLLHSRDQDLGAGIVLSLATVKFQYIVTVVLLLLLCRKFRLFSGFVLGSAILGGVSILVVGPSGIMQYVRFVLNFDVHGGYGSLHPDLMVNWRGFLFGLGLVRNLRLYSSIGSVGLILAGFLCCDKGISARDNGLRFALFVAIAVAASPYAFYEDATLLSLPIVLAMERVLSQDGHRTIRASIKCCCLLMFLWPIILMICGGHYWWNSDIYLMFPLIILFIGLVATAVNFGSRTTSESLTVT